MHKLSNKLVLNASAGTGKTYRLSLEYIASLYKGVDFKEILVMTFTRKATSEIKIRIIDFIKKIISKGEEGLVLKEHIRKLYPDLEMDDEKLNLAYENLIKNKDKLNIYTIDAFINTIFKKAIAPHMNVYSYDIETDDAVNKNYYSLVLEKILKNPVYFEKFKTYISNSSEKNVENYIADIENLINNRWKFIVIGKNKKLREKLPVENNPTVYLEEIFDKISSVAEIENEYDSKERTFRDYIYANYKYYTDLSDIKKSEELKKNFKSYIGSVEKEKNILWKKTISVKEVKGKNAEKREKINPIAEEINEIHEKFSKELSSKIFNEEVIDFEKNLMEVSEIVYKIYDDLRIRDASFSYTDISTHTFINIVKTELNFIKDSKVTSDFLEILDIPLDTVFIDEFQDTSILQWRILSAIINAAKTVICVGDPKQSIYGWRGGAKELFEKLEDIIKADRNETLDTSYRSKKSIIDFTNDIFKLVPQTLEWKFESVKANTEEIAKIDKIDFKDEGKKNGELYKDIVDEIKNNFNSNYKGIAIISRTNKILNEISKVLAVYNIPFNLNSKKDILLENGIFEIVELLKYLADEKYLNLLNVLKSPCFSLTNKTLKFLIVNEVEIKKYINSEIKIVEGISEYKDLDKLFLIKNIKTEFNKRNSIGKDFIKRIIDDLSIINTYSTDSDISNIYNFYYAAMKYENIIELLIDIENGKLETSSDILSESENKIELMTVHKSKGLEFDTVFYVVDKNINRSDSGLSLYFEMDEEYSELNDYLLTHSRYSSVIENLYPKLSYANTLKKEQEEINNNYVALTRAKNNLIIFQNVKKDSTSHVDDFLEKLNKYDYSKYNLSEYLQKEEEKDASSKNEVKSFQLDLKVPEIIIKEDNEKVINFYGKNLESEDKRMLGIVVHFFLENIKYNTVAEIEFARKLTLSEYSSYFGRDKLETILSEKNINYIISTNLEIFSEKWDYIHSELEIYLEDENTNHRLDRVMIKKHTKDSYGEIYVVDYKTGKKNNTQLQRYEAAIRKMLSKQGLTDNYVIKTEYIELKIKI